MHIILYNCIPFCPSHSFYQSSRSTIKSWPGVPRVGKLHAGSPDISCARYNPGGQHILPSGQKYFYVIKNDFFEAIFLVGQAAKIDQNKRCPRNSILNIPVLFNGFHLQHPKISHLLTRLGRHLLKIAFLLNFQRLCQKSI